MDNKFKITDETIVNAVKVMASIKAKPFDCKEISETDKAAYNALDKLLFGLGVECPNLDDDYFIVWYNQNYNFSEETKFQIDREFVAVKKKFEKYVEEELRWINMVKAHV